MGDGSPRYKMESAIALICGSTAKADVAKFIASDGVPPFAITLAANVLPSADTKSLPDWAF